MVTPLVAPTVMVPCDTASVVFSVSPVLGHRYRNPAQRDRRVLVAADEAGTASDTVVVWASVMSTVFVPDVALLLGRSSLAAGCRAVIVEVAGVVRVRGSAPRRSLPPSRSASPCRYRCRTMVTPLVAATVMVPCDTASVVISVSAGVKTIRHRNTAQRDRRVLVAASEAGTASDTVVVSASVTPPSSFPMWRCCRCRSCAPTGCRAVIVEVAGVVRVRAPGQRRVDRCRRPGQRRRRYRCRRWSRRSLRPP